MSKNLIENGGFDTGDFKYWTVQAYGKPASVAHHNRSFQARMEPGEDTGQLLFTSFAAGPGLFTVALEASAPRAKYQEDPPHPDTHALIVFFFSGFAADGTAIQSDVGAWWLRRNQQRFQYTGNMLAGVVKAEVRLSFPSDPLQVKGELFVDSVEYKPGTPKHGRAHRWSH